MKSNLYQFPVPPSRREERPVPPREKIVYLPDCLERREPFFTWERTPGLTPWMEALSLWSEVFLTLVMTVFSIYWMWYAMCVMV